MALAGISGATRMTMTGNGEQVRCMVREPSDGPLVSDMTESGLKGKKTGWACSLGEMARPMTASGSLERSMASGYVLQPSLKRVY